MIIDTAQNTVSNIVHLEADAVTDVMRYLTTNTRSSKLVTIAEAKALANAGIRLGLVFETGGGAPGQPPLTAAMGQQDGAFAAHYAPGLGAPQDACVYFAADNDFRQSEIEGSILPYFGAIYQVLKDSGFNVGVYGSGAVCQAVINEVSADYAWLSGSMGWTGSRAYLTARPGALRLVQDKMNTTLANLSCDTDYALGDFGSFLPFAATLTASAQPAKVEPQTMYQKLMGWIS